MHIYVYKDVNCETLINGLLMNKSKYDGDVIWLKCVVVCV